MKKMVIFLMFFCSFSVGNISALAVAVDGGTIATVVNSKTGQTACSFELPKDYQPKNNPIEITISQGKIVLYASVSNDLAIVLPSNLSGILNVTVKVDGFIFTKEISF